MQQRHPVDIVQLGAPEVKKARVFFSMTKKDMLSWVGSDVQHGAELYNDHQLEASGVAKLCTMCCSVTVISLSG